MMMTKRVKHFHRYKKDVLGRGYVIYKCTIPGCTHYIAETLLINRVAACGKCNEPFVIGKKESIMAIPRCENCVNSSSKDELAELDKLVNERM
jgi:hypothetical protein